MNRKIYICSLLLGLSALGCGDDGNMTPDPDMGMVPDTGMVPDMGPDCPEGDVVVSGEISEDTQWSCPTYLLQGRVFVTGNSTLTIDAGVVIYGDERTPDRDGAALIVTRGSELIAVGTAAEPIVFTPVFDAGERAAGQWAGVALLGAATLNNGTLDNGVFRDQIEGINVEDIRGNYGGNDDASSCGNLQYVRIEFAGQELQAGNELNGLTLGGCGSGTRLSYIQVHRGSDDGVEFFGGTASIDHVMISGPGDDGLDWDQGWRGNAQFVAVHMFATGSEHAIEADNFDGNETATPRSNPNIYNATLYGFGTSRGILLRRGTHGTLRNLLVVNHGTEAVDLRGTTADSIQWPSQLSIANSAFFGNAAYADESMGSANDDFGFMEEASITDAARMNMTLAAAPGFASTSITAPNFVPTNTALNGQATPPAGLDTTATYAGAFAPGGANWAAGWTAYPEN